MPKLVVLSQELAGKEFQLIGERLQVGRGPDNEIRIEDGSVSTRHAELVAEGNDYLLRDLDSTNGTKINGEPVSERKLAPGDAVRFGRIDCRYDAEAKHDSKPLPPITRGIDLNSERTTRSTVFQNVSPFRKKQKTSNKFLQMGILALAAIALVTFLVLLYKFNVR